MTEESKQKRKDYMRKWRAANKERIAAYQRERRISTGFNRRGQYDPAEYLLNRERVLANQKKYRSKNKENENNRKKRWRLANPVEARLHVQARRAKIRGKRINKKDITNWDTRVCGICLKVVEGEFELDHIIPLSRGGEHSADNLQFAHPHCNRVKWNKLSHELQVVYA